MLNQTAEYALRAVVHLATLSGEQPVRVDDIAEALSVPRNYLSKILHVLAKSGVLGSVRGPKGGFTLAVAPSSLTLGEVVSPFDPIDAQPSCLLGRPQCRDDRPCAAHDRWKEISASLRSFFHETTLADLIAKEDAAAEMG